MNKTLSRREAGALALGAAFTGTAAAAQTYPAPMNHGAMGHAPVSHGPMSHAPMSHAMGLTRGDQRYVSDTMMAGSAALQTSQLALSRAGSPGVRQFAEFEVREQTGISQVLGEISGMRAPPPPDPQMAAMAAQLARSRGLMFDRLYVQGQIEGHSRLLRIQEDYLRGGRNAHLRHVATLSRGQILDHLTLLRSGLLLRG